MLLTLKEEHQEHLKFFINQPNQVVQDFCQLACIHVEKGPNLKAYNNAAQKLDVSPDTIKNSVEALVFLSMEASRYKVSEEELLITLIGLGYSPELRELLSTWVQSQQSTMCLESMQPSFPHYTSLEWRLEARMASRSLLLQQGNATVTMRLTLGANNLVLRCTPSMLRHLVFVFEAALKEANSRHARRALRGIK